MRILQITSLGQPPLYSYIPLSWMGNFNELPGNGLMFFFTIAWTSQFLIPVPFPSKKNIPLLLVVKNRPSDNQISSYDFLKIHKFGIQPGLQITFPEKIPPRLMVKNSPLIAKINCKNFSSHPEHSYQFSLSKYLPEKYPSLLVQFQTPFDNLKKPISLKVHIQL